MLQARSFTTVALALLCAVALLPARRAAAQRVFGDPEFLRDAAALGLQREGPVPDYENLTATAQLARAGAEPDAAARGAQATAAAGGPLAEAPGASAPNACQVELEWSATSEVSLQITAAGRSQAALASLLCLQPLGCAGDWRVHRPPV